MAGPLRASHGCPGSWPWVPRRPGCSGAGNQNCTRCYNTTTVIYPINRKNFTFNWMGDLRCGRPIQSVHPGGANALFADGHVAFLSDNIPLITLKNLADRDDGNVIPPLD